MHQNSIYGVEDGKAWTGSLITEDAIFSKQIANVKDPGFFICETEGPGQVSKCQLSWDLFLNSYIFVASPCLRCIEVY